VGTSLGFGVSTFLLSVLFIGFDPDNLAVGTVASAEGVSGIAMGSILGGAMVAVAFAFGVSALVAPMTFAQVSLQILAVQMVAVVLFGALALDGQLWAYLSCRWSRSSSGARCWSAARRPS
jgi:cation:H+ antiporter